MDFGIRGKNALVFGSSSGIGRGIAKALIEEGARVGISARDPKRLEKAASEIGAALSIPADLLTPGSGRAVVQDVISKWGGIDILVTNVGGPPKGDFSEITNEQWQTGFQGLWLSAADAIQAALPGMTKRKWGRIIMVTSSAAKEPIAHLTISNGLRAGLLGLAKSLCHEVASDGVTVNVILPGYTRTERLKELGIAEEQMTRQIPAGRLGTPEELGALAAFLASTQAGYITGQAITADGGITRGI